ncbi:hypothetical protein Bca4012_050864 [Brassica carinata]
MTSWSWKTSGSTATSGFKRTSGSKRNLRVQNNLRVLNTTSGSEGTSGFPNDLRVYGSLRAPLTTFGSQRHLWVPTTSPGSEAIPRDLLRYQESTRLSPGTKMNMLNVPPAKSKPRQDSQSQNSWVLTHTLLHTIHGTREPQEMQTEVLPELRPSIATEAAQDIHLQSGCESFQTEHKYIQAYSIRKFEDPGYDPTSYSKFNKELDTMFTIVFKGDAKFWFGILPEGVIDRGPKRACRD